MLSDEIGKLAARIPPIEFMECTTIDGYLEPHQLSKCSNHVAKWSCGACGHEWDSIINNVTRQGKGCIRCSGNNAERRVGAALEEAALAGRLYSVRAEWRPEGERFRFDFLVRSPDGDPAVVEVDGPQHFGPWSRDAPGADHADRLRRDVEKMAWAAARGIPTVRVPTSAVPFCPTERGWMWDLLALVDDALETREPGDSPMVVSPAHAETYAAHAAALREAPRRFTRVHAPPVFWCAL
jgi:very-short-patch-repair endonuclease